MKLKRLSNCSMVILSAMLCFSINSFSLENGVARTPPMGFNDWNQFMVATLPVTKSIADSIVSTGLRDLGYVYINRDGGSPGHAIIILSVPTKICQTICMRKVLSFAAI